MFFPSYMFKRKNGLKLLTSDVIVRYWKNNMFNLVFFVSRSSGFLTKISSQSKAVELLSKGKMRHFQMFF